MSGEPDRDLTDDEWREAGYELTRWGWVPKPKALPDGMAKLSDLCCGCGSPDLFYEAALEILEHFAQDHGARDYQWVYGDKFRYLAVNALDSVGLLEHGAGIAGSWLTDLGKEALAFLREHGKEWDDKGPWLDSEGVTHGRL